MKILFVTIYLLIVLATLGNAQNNGNNSAKAGISYISMDSKYPSLGKLWGIGFYNEFNRKVSTVLTLAPSLQFGYASRQGDFPYYLMNNMYGGIDLNLFLTPIKLGFSSAKVGLGPSTRFFKGSDINESVSVLSRRKNSSTDWDLVNLYARNRTQIPVSLDLGYSAIIETQFDLPQQWNLSLRATYQEFLKNESILSIGLNVGKSF